MKKITIFILITTLILFGCSKNKQQGQENVQLSQSGQKEDEPSKELITIEKNIEKIVEALDGPASKKEDSKDKEDKEKSQDQKGDNKEGGSKSDQGESQGQGKQDQEQQGQEQGKQGQEQGQKQETAKETPAPAPKKDPWQTISPVINTMHYEWNSYMPLALKSGATAKLTNDFSAALNGLTSTIINKDAMNTLMATNRLYSYIPDFYSLYKGQNNSGIKRIRYYTRNVILNSNTSNWVQADSDINSLKEVWALEKTKIKSEQQEISNKIELSINELEKVAKEKNQPLVGIKGRVTLSNLDNIEKEGNKSSSTNK